jgi:proteasome assembly chaperone (PAC2) family protein
MANSDPNEGVRIRVTKTPRPRPPRAVVPAAAPELQIDRVPQLRQPILVMAFEGWNDAGEAATTAARLLVSHRDGQKFATVDPEEFFVFTDTRPHVRTTRRGRRRIDWPSNEFYACLDPETGPAARDLVVLLGTEPDLRWRHFSNLVFDVAERCGVELIVGLGALNADVPHTKPVRVSGSTANADRHTLTRHLGMRPSKYEGPTGILSILSQRFSDADLPVLSLWGWAPHYITATPNPVVASRILREVGRVLEIDVDTQMIDEAAQRFDEQVREAVSKDPEAMAYVRDLEREAHDEDDEDERPDSSPLPSGPAMVDALEEFLRSRRRRHGPSGQ